MVTPNFIIIQGDSRKRLKEIANCSVDSIVTDPPAGISFMGKNWDHNKGGRDAWVAWMTEIMRECLRVLKPGGHALVWAIPRTSHWTGWAIESAGFEVRDRVSHLFGSGFPKSLDVSKAIDAAAGAEREIIGPNPHARPNQDGLRIWVGDKIGKEQSHPPLTAAVTDAAKQWNGWGTALKPACEDWWLARKPFIGTVAQNILQHRTGGLNIDGCRIGSDIVGWQGDPSNGYSGGLNSIEPDGRPILGRWPANVIHDGSEEVLAGFPGDVGANGGNGQFEQHAWMRQQSAQSIERSKGSAARFFYCPKASKQDREDGLDDLPIHSAGDVTDRKDGSDGLNSPRAGAGRTNGSRNHHPTVKPTDLMRYLCRLVTPPGGTVLDPFCGSGSTGRGALLEGFNFIGIELDTEYCALAEKRIGIIKQVEAIQPSLFIESPDTENAMQQTGLFAEVNT